MFTKIEEETFEHLLLKILRIGLKESIAQGNVSESLKKGTLRGFTIKWENKRNKNLILSLEKYFMLQLI